MFRHPTKINMARAVVQGHCKSAAALVQHIDYAWTGWRCIHMMLARNDLIDAAFSESRLNDQQHVVGLCTRAQGERWRNDSK